MKEQIRNLLQKEINYHSKEIEKHFKLKELRQSKKEKRKAIKHLDKKSQTIKIANKLGFKLCECCGGLR